VTLACYGPAWTWERIDEDQVTDVLEYYAWEAWSKPASQEVLWVEVTR